MAVAPVLVPEGPQHFSPSVDLVVSEVDLERRNAFQCWVGHRMEKVSGQSSESGECYGRIHCHLVI